MKKILIIALLLVALASCRSTKLMPSEPIILNHSDRVRVEYFERVVFDTLRVFVQVPMQSATQVVMDSTSHLETDFAESDAWINPDGTLGHSIKNKTQSVASDVIVPSKTIERSITESKENEVPKPTPVYVERDFTKWERFRLNSFWYLVAISAVCIFLIIRKKL